MPKKYPMSKAETKRRKAINIAASLAATGTPYNNEALSPETFAAIASKLGKYGRAAGLTRRRRKP